MSSDSSGQPAVTPPTGFTVLAGGDAKPARPVSKWRARLSSPDFWLPNFWTVTGGLGVLVVTITLAVVIPLGLHWVQAQVSDVKSSISSVTGDSTSVTPDPSSF